VRRTSWILGLALVFPFIASGQNFPRVDIFGGYTYTKVSSYSVPLAVISQGGLGTFTLPAYGLNGWTGGATVSANKWFGVTGEFTDLYGTPVKAYGSTPLSSREHEYSYLFGPRLSYRGKRWTPFVHALFGGAHGTVLVSASGVNVPIIVTENKFAMAIGGGLDFKIQKHVAVRLIQTEYGMTRFVGSHQNNMRISTGLLLSF